MIWYNRTLPLILFIYASLVDFVQTNMAATMPGFHEANPLMAGVIGTPYFLAAKLGAILVVSLWVYLVGKLWNRLGSNMRRLIFGALWVSALAQMGVCGWNLLQIL